MSSLFCSAGSLILANHRLIVVRIVVLNWVITTSRWLLTRIRFVLLVLAIISSRRWLVMLLTMTSRVTLCVTFIALSTMLSYKFNLRNHFFTSTPGNRWLWAHIATYYLIIINWIHQQWIRSAFAALLVCHDISYGVLLLFTGKPFDLSQQLIVPLNLVNHLAVDVFNVEILTGHDESSDATSIVI